MQDWRKIISSTRWSRHGTFWQFAAGGRLQTVGHLCHNCLPLHLRQRYCGGGGGASRRGILDTVVVHVKQTLHSHEHSTSKDEIVDGIILQHVEVKVHDTTWVHRPTSKMHRHLQQHPWRLHCTTNAHQPPFTSHEIALQQWERQQQRSRHTRHLCASINIGVMNVLRLGGLIATTPISLGYCESKILVLRTTLVSIGAPNRLYS